MISFVGLGLHNAESITLEGLKVLKESDVIFLEAYTSILGVDREQFEEKHQLKLQLADRELVEQSAELKILQPALNGKKVAFLVVGDPFGATTHSDLHLRAVTAGIPVKVIHNASIMNAIACCGLQLYLFGQAVSITFFEGSILPRSTYDKLQVNVRNHFHSLCLLDIKVKEQTVENLCKGNDIYEPPRYMSVQVAAKQLLQMEEEFQQEVCGAKTCAFGVARVGHTDQVIISGTLQQLADAPEETFGKPLHTLVLCGDNMHPEERVWYDHYQIKNE